MNKNNLTELFSSSNPLDRVKARLLSRIEVIEEYPAINPAMKHRDQDRLEAFAAAVAEIDQELALETVVGGHVETALDRLKAALADHEAGR